MDYVLCVDHIPVAILGWLCRSLGKFEEIITLIMLTKETSSKLHSSVAVANGEGASRRTSGIKSKSSVSYGSLEENIVAVENMPSDDHLSRVESAQTICASVVEDFAAQETNWWDYVTLEVWIVLLVYFVNRIGQELIISSSALLTSQLFSWTSEQCGYFMAIAGALVLPLNLLSSWLFKDTEDRLALSVLSVICVLSSALICCVAPHDYSSTQYIVGCIVLFGALNAIEGTIMCLLSRLVSPLLANSTFNSGLLATEAGTLGRVFGDAYLAWAGYSREGAQLVNMLFIPFTICMVSTLYCVYNFYDRLEA